MRIKTRESLRSIKTFDRAENLAQKTKGGGSSLKNSAEETQNRNYEFESEYAGNELQSNEEMLGRNSIYGAKKVGEWGIKETRKNIYKWKNRPRKLKVDIKPKQLPPPQRPALPPGSKKGIKTSAKAGKNTAKATKNTAKAAKTTAKATKVDAKQTVKASVRAA